MKKPAICKFTLSVLFLFSFIGILSAQNVIKVSGTITDSKNAPMIGASVFEKGTRNGVITDADGKYSISLPEGSVLVFSSIGFTTQERKAVAGTLNIVMEEDQKLLDEVVVIGYGIQKKSSVTGAISQVKSEDMQNRTITRPEQALQGKTAGVQIFQSSASPGASPTVRIRGINSNGSCDPLYVVDGRIASDIGGIDPNDIESMEVLKDAASAAIYGAAAGNGVILITTKKGKAGQGNVTYDFQLSIQNIARIPKVLNAEQYIEYMTEANYISMDKINSTWDFKTNTDWSKVAFESSIMQKHNLAFQGGNDKGTYFLSLSYLDNNGYVVGDADVYKRFTATINADYNIKKWLQVGTNNQIEYYTRKAVAEGSEYGSLLSSVIQLDPLTPVKYSPDNLPEHMQTMVDAGKHYLTDKDGNYYSTSAFLETEDYNPYIMRDKSQSTSSGYNINGVIYANLKPVRGLVLTSRLGYRLSAARSYTVNNDFYVNTTVNQNYMSVNASASTPIYLQWENFANYMHSFGKHNITAMVGTSFIDNSSFYVSGNVTGGDGDFGFKKDDPRYAYFAYATATAVKTVYGGEEIIGRKLAYFGRLSYDYAGKYMAQFSLRADAADSSVLPVAKRWGYFPAASLGWTISQENFMKGAKSWLSHLKLRGSWGQNGTTSSLGSYAYLSSISSSVSYPYTNELVYNTGSSPSSTGNNELKWETSEQLDLGIDARFFRDRLTLTADWYTKKTKDLIVTGITPSTIVGNTASPVNAGNIENKGVELELGWKDNIGDFNYSIRGNIATLKNEVTYIHESLDRINGASYHTASGVTVFEKGYPAWYFRGYKLDHIDAETGDPVFVDKDQNGVINDADKMMIGSGIPDFTYGITLNASFKGFDLTIFGTGSQGNDIMSCSGRGDRLQANKLKLLYTDRWTPTHTNATRPRPGATDIDKYWLSSGMVFDGSYFKIKQIQLGYSLPKALLKKARINNVRVYCSLDDFFTFTSYPGFDPEVTGVGNATGIDKGYYPSARKLVFGLNLNF